MTDENNNNKGTPVALKISLIGGIVLGVVAITTFGLPYLVKEDAIETQRDQQDIESETMSSNREVEQINTQDVESDTVVVEKQAVKEVTKEQPSVVKEIPKTTKVEKNNSITNFEHYTVYANGTAIDNNTGRMWMRCSLGQNWDGSTCVGKAKKYTWDETFRAIKKLNSAGYAGHHQWELPHIEDYYGLIHCRQGMRSTGVEYPDTIPLRLGGEKQVQKCIGGGNKKSSPTINRNVFPKTRNDSYWSSSTYGKGSYTAWGVDFNLGLADNYGKDYRGYIRAVRSN